MSAEIINESVFWLYCLLCGMAISLVYDLLRVLRRVIKHGEILVALEDIMFWIGVCIGVFLLLYHMNQGTVRWFAVFGLFFGMVIYKKILGEKLVIFMSTIFCKTLHLVGGIVTPPLKLVKCAFYKVFHAMARGLCTRKNELTGNIKGGNIELCKHKKERDTYESKTSSESKTEPV